MKKKRQKKKTEPSVVEGLSEPLLDERYDHKWKRKISSRPLREAVGEALMEKAQFFFYGPMVARRYVVAKARPMPGGLTDYFLRLIIADMRADPGEGTDMMADQVEEYMRERDMGKARGKVRRPDVGQPVTRTWEKRRQQQQQWEEREEEEQY